MSVVTKQRYGGAFLEEVSKYERMAVVIVRKRWLWERGPCAFPWIMMGNSPRADRHYMAFGGSLKGLAGDVCCVWLGSCVTRL